MPPQIDKYCYILVFFFTKNMVVVCFLIYLDSLHRHAYANNTTIKLIYVVGCHK